MKEGEQRAKSASQEDYIIPITNRAREGLFIGIQAKEDAIEERGGVMFCFDVAVEFEELWKEGKDECERYLRQFS